MHSGVATDETGKPVAGATVRAGCLAINGRGYGLPDLTETVTDENGRFVFKGLPIGYAEVYCPAEGLYHVNWVAVLHDVPSERDVELKLVRSGSIKITVTGLDPAFGGEYIAEIEPEGGSVVGSWGGSSTLDPNGKAHYDSVPPGKYTVYVRANPGRGRKADDPNVKAIVVEGGKTTEVKYEGPLE